MPLMALARVLRVLDAKDATAEECGFGNLFVFFKVAFEVLGVVWMATVSMPPHVQTSCQNAKTKKKKF